MNEQTNPGLQENIDEARLPCPARPLWHDLPPSLGSGIPGRVRSARPIPPRLAVTEFLRPQPPGFRISQGGLRPSAWIAPDQSPSQLGSEVPIPVTFNTAFPPIAARVANSPSIPSAANLGDWIAEDKSAPSVADCAFAGLRQPVCPAVVSSHSVEVVVASPQLAWNLTNTFFTPRRRIAQPEPAMRPLPAPESHSRPMARARVQPTQVAGILEAGGWKLADNGKPVIPNCGNVVQPVSQQMANPRPLVPLRPKYVFQDTYPAWKTAPNSYVPRIELDFFTEAVTLVAISPPLVPLAH